MLLRLYLDTAEVARWQEWMPSGIFYGVTCNPLLLERANVPCTLPSMERLAKTALDLGAQEVHIQTWGRTVDELFTVGEHLANIAPEVVVKVPITRIGTFAAASLIKTGTRITVTAVYASHQVATAMALGATYAAPYLGRMDEGGRDGHEAVVRMQRMIQKTDSPMRLLVASLRHVSDISALTQDGVRTFTLAPALIPHLFEDASTIAAAEDFERAAAAMGSTT